MQRKMTQFVYTFVDLKMKSTNLAGSESQLVAEYELHEPAFTIMSKLNPVSIVISELDANLFADPF